MFRITKDQSPGSLVECLARNYKNDSIVFVDMDKVGVSSLNYTHAQKGQNKLP